MLTHCMCDYIGDEKPNFTICFDNEEYKEDVTPDPKSVTITNEDFEEASPPPASMQPVSQPQHQSITPINPNQTYMVRGDVLLSQYPAIVPMQVQQQQQHQQTVPKQQNKEPTVRFNGDSIVTKGGHKRVIHIS